MLGLVIKYHMMKQELAEDLSEGDQQLWDGSRSSGSFFHLPEAHPM